MSIIFNPPCSNVPVNVPVELEQAALDMIVSYRRCTDGNPDTEVRESTVAKKYGKGTGSGVNIAPSTATFAGGLDYHVDIEPGYFDVVDAAAFSNVDKHGLAAKVQTPMTAHVRHAISAALHFHIDHDDLDEPDECYFVSTVGGGCKNEP